MLPEAARAEFPGLNDAEWWELTLARFAASMRLSQRTRDLPPFVYPQVRQRRPWWRISAKGVLGGGVLGIGATYALSIPLMALAIVQLDLMQLPEPEFHAALMKALAPGSPYHLVGLVLGSAGGILGGYVSARIAKHDERLNGALSAWLFMLLQTYNWATGGATETALAHIGYLVASPAMGALGGYLWERTRSKALSAPITSPAA